jgi:hypothetical protein
VLADTGGDSSLLIAPVGASGARDEAIDYLKQLPRALPVVVG